MSHLTFEQIRVPAAIVLVLIAVVVFFPRGGEEGASATPSPVPTIVVGQPGGSVTEATTPEPEPTPVPTLTPLPTASPSPTAAPTPPPAADGFGAEVLACRSISGSECNGRLGTLRPNAGSFTALVRFTDATAGDTMNAILTGPAGRIDGFPYTLQGSGDGYYYTTFTAGGLPAGDYTLTATRNGQEVAVTTFRKVGG
jgi:hypothetical protein